jgi:DNA-directed RNA polymerase specialized sigma24 family protein
MTKIASYQVEITIGEAAQHIANAASAAAGGPKERVIPEALAALAKARHAIETAIGQEVLTAQLDGYTWKQIGRELGVSAQAAHKRYAR